MKTKKMDVFKAIEVIKQKISKYIGVRQIDLTFQVYDNKRTIRVLVFHDLENVRSGNFSVSLHTEFNDTFEIQTIIDLCMVEITKIKPTSETQFEVTL